MLQDPATLKVITALSNALRSYLHEHDDLDAESCYPLKTSGCPCSRCREARKALIEAVELQRITT